MLLEPIRRLAVILPLTVPALIASANPLSASSGIGAASTNALFGRGCVNPCGWADQLCCNSNEACYTDTNNKAQCSATAAGGRWSTFTTRITTTLVEAEATVVTLLASTYIAPPPTTTTVVAICDSTKNWSSCGPICCASDQFCAALGQCAATATGSAASFGAPVVATQTAVTTVGFSSPVETGSSSGGDVYTQYSKPSSGLSGGAIAGIVIGVLAGVILLIAFCICCFVKGIWDLIFGRNSKRKRRTERRSYYAGGSRPSRVSRSNRGALGAGAGLGAAATWLGFRKREEHRERNQEWSEKASEYTDDWNNADQQSAYSARPRYEEYYDQSPQYPPPSADPHSAGRERIFEETIIRRGAPPRRSRSRR